MGVPTLAGSLSSITESFFLLPSFDLLEPLRRDGTVGALPPAKVLLALLGELIESRGFLGVLGLAVGVPGVVTTADDNEGEGAGRGAVDPTIGGAG